MSTVEYSEQGPVAHVMLNRPDVRNAFNDAVIGELSGTLHALPNHVRVVVLGGHGAAFSAGADLEWMKASAAHTHEENLRDAATMLRMFDALDQSPKAVVARVQGAAFGGALGLLACCDVVIAAESTKMAFSEAKLGLVPAVISPYVMRKIGYSQSRRYFMTGEVFGAERARELGLVHEVVPDDHLDAAVEKTVKGLLANGPIAVGEAKRLVREMWRRDMHDPKDALDFAVALIAQLRASPEGQEGLAAFLEKRKAAYAS